MTGEILVSDLCSHGNTETALKIDPSGPYREGHYLPDGKIECRVVTDDGVSSDTCNKLLKARFPRFIDFYNWCMKQDGVDIEWLDLNSLTALPEGFRFPDGVKWLYLNHTLKRKLNGKQH